MSSSLNRAAHAAITLAAAMVLAAPAEGDAGVAQLRFLSHAARDRLPGIDEAKSFHESKDRDAALAALLTEWLAGDEHRQRVRRYFHDMFGMEPWVFVAEDVYDLRINDPGDPDAAANRPSDLSEAGVYFLPKEIKPSCGGAPVQASAWWSDEAIRICPSAVSSATLLSDGQIRCTEAFAPEGIRHASCGCGPDQIICFPKAQKGRIVAGVSTEFRERGLYAYEHGLSWRELLGGELFIGDRWLWHHYLYQERLISGSLPTAAETAFLKALPLDDIVAVAFPDTGPERSGVATAPGFLRRFNNFRSRVRALSNELLCQDIDPSLDATAESQGFVNATLTDFDRLHGTKEECAGCHYPMDNQGSTLLNWNDTGFWEFWNADVSQAGWVFGEPGEGPRFLMDGYVGRDARFLPCMARSAYEDFASAGWDALAADDQRDFLTLAADGPRALIQGILTSSTVRGLRAAGAASIAKAGKSYDFTADVQPILERSCAGSACHSADTVRGPGSAYAGSEAVARTIDATRVSGGSMPPADSGKTLSAEDKAVLVDWLQGSPLH